MFYASFRVYNLFLFISKLRKFKINGHDDIVDETILSLS